jgi:hypothetical protein
LFHCCTIITFEHDYTMVKWPVVVGRHSRILSFLLILKGTNSIHVSEQKNPDLGLKNFKYGVGLVVKAILLEMNCYLRKYIHLCISLTSFIPLNE